MARKKLADMTPYKRVEERLVGLSNEEVEDIAIKMLAQTVAKAVYVRGDEQYIMQLVKRICEKADEFAKSHSFEIAMGKVIYEQEQGKTNKD